MNIGKFLKKIKKKGKSQKGSFTVEAALVMPLILLVLFGTMYLCFYVHNRAFLTSAAYEAALDGRLEGVKKNGDAGNTALLKAKELGNTGFFGAQNLTCSAREESKSKINVGYDLDTISTYGGYSWHLSLSASLKIIKPVKTLQTIKAAEDIIS